MQAALEALNQMDPGTKEYEVAVQELCDAASENTAGLLRFGEALRGVTPPPSGE